MKSERESLSSPSGAEESKESQNSRIGRTRPEIRTGFW